MLTPRASHGDNARAAATVFNGLPSANTYLDRGGRGLVVNNETCCPTTTAPTTPHTATAPHTHTTHAPHLPLARHPHHSTHLRAPLPLHPAYTTTDENERTDGWVLQQPGILTLAQLHRR